MLFKTYTFAYYNKLHNNCYLIPRAFLVLSNIIAEITFYNIGFRLKYTIVCVYFYLPFFMNLLRLFRNLYNVVDDLLLYSVVVEYFFLFIYDIRFVFTVKDRHL